FDRGIIDFDAPGLVLGRVLENSQPMQIVKYRVSIFLPRAEDVGVVESLNESPAMLQREEPVEQRRAGIADMDLACWRRGKTDSNGHGRGVADRSEEHTSE